MSVRPFSIQTTRFALALAAATFVASPASHAAEAPGMRIVKDPVTGELRAPTHEEFKAMQDQQLRERALTRSAAPAAAPVAVRNADGSVKIMLDESQMSYAVVTRNGDGSLTEHCVTGAVAASKLVSGKRSKAAKTSKAAKEHS